MKKLDFNSYLVDELSKVLHNDDFLVSYVYRHHNRPSIFIRPLVDDTNDVAICELKQLCLSSKSLGHSYIISLEHVLFKRTEVLVNGKIGTIALHAYELTMPNNVDFKSVVKRLEYLQLSNNIYSLKSKKGGVK